MPKVKKEKKSRTCNILSLDLSTSATGWARFEVGSRKLLECGVFEGKDFKSEFPWNKLDKIHHMIDQILPLIHRDHYLAHIVIEEVNLHKSRTSGKLLDGLHYLLLDRMRKECMGAFTVSYIDSDGLDGWRGAKGLKLFLTDQDKLLNKERKVLNKHIKKRNKSKKKRIDKEKQYPIITKKHLACRWANRTFGLNLDYALKDTDGDVADALGLGWVFVNRR